MATTAALASCTLVWMATFMLLNNDSEPHIEQFKGHVHVLTIRLIHLADILGGLPLVSQLLSRESFCILCNVVQARWPQTFIDRKRSCGAIIIVITIVLLACAALAHSLIGLVVALICIVFGIPAWASARKRREASQLAAEMPGVFRTLAMALGSGETLSQAVEYVGVNGDGPSGRAFARASLALRCGASIEEVLSDLAEQLDAPGVGLLVSALLIAQRSGSPLVSLLQRSATLVERAGEFERLLTVKTAQVRLSVRVVCLLPVVLVVALSFMSADFQQGLMTPVGLTCITLAASADIVAVILIRRMIGAVL